MYAKILKETENEETRLFATFLSLVAFGLGGATPVPGYAYDCNFNAICDIMILCAFLLVCPSMYVKATLVVLLCSVLYDHTKYVILLVKVKIVLL